jgi:hypothetical protein
VLYRLQGRVQGPTVTQSVYELFRRIVDIKFLKTRDYDGYVRSGSLLSYI